ncbi:helix-turn-helix domain-containing protein [Leptolyngbya sp. 7M]|uniref:helix-turn-helix domain-containing protein n=1 Tax=Leptolyngbya sp. 7M TaxID=2812896 RepID=UPI001B8CFBD5|nr:helix-turn-helix domain-containing protein [Leptolyngbya sp. 7M]QYO65525.1 helix-turn-helix domain containing protein [Leptolyngbya sp. 7M]
MNEDFVMRLKRAFGFGTMADIARRIDVPHATVRNYFQGRLPAPEVLIKIADETNVSLNWLLTGRGEMFISGRNIDIGQLIDERIEALIEKKLTGRLADDVQNLGAIDARPPFDVESAVREFGDPARIMDEWFQYEGRAYPADLGIVFFQGWESYSHSERVEAVRDAKKVIDRTLRNMPKPDGK